MAWSSRHQVGVAEGARVGQERRAQDPVVGGVGQHGLVVQRIVVQGADGPDPGVPRGRAGLGVEGVVRLDGAEVDGPGSGGRGSGMRSARARIMSSSEASPSGDGTSGIGDWCEKPSSFRWKEADMLKIAFPC